MSDRGHLFTGNDVRDSARAHFGDNYTFQTCSRQATFSERSSKNLLKAAKEGQSARVKICLEQKADPDLADEEGSTSLHYAVLRSSDVMVSDLVKGGADLNAQSERYGTPLLLAVLQDDLNIVELLAESDVTKPLEKFGTALHAAAYMGNEMMLVALASGYVSRDCRLPTSVDLAAYVRLIRRRTKTKRNSDAVTLDGITPFILAARQGNLQILRHFIDLFNQRSQSVLSARSGQNGHSHSHDLSRIPSGVMVHTPDLLNDKDSNGQTALMHAAQRAHKTCVEFLVNERSLLNTTTFSGDTALSLCLEGATERHCEAATSLIKSGACCEWRDDQGNTLLHLAAANDHRHALDELAQKRPGRNCNPSIDAGGINSVNCEGQTALSLAAKQDHEECARTLIAAGACVDLAEEPEWPPVVHAAARGYLAILQQLLDKNTDLLARTPGGATALHKAAEQGHISILKCLLNRADALKPQLLAATDNAKQTALHVAALYHQTAAVDILRQAGANAGLKDRDGNTVWDIAESHRDDDVRAVLKKHKEREAREHYERSVAFPKRPVRRLRWSSLFF